VVVVVEEAGRGGGEEQAEERGGNGSQVAGPLDRFEQARRDCTVRIALSPSLGPTYRFPCSPASSFG
jgi:hypothetical protein